MLLNTKLPILTEFDQLRPGLEVEGFIAKIGESGVLVVFYNEMKVRKGEVASLYANPFARSPGQVKIMKEFV